MVCDGITDCPDGEDELNCASLLCEGHLKCKVDNICVHSSDICDGTVQCLQSLDDEIMCEADFQCPDYCSCHGYMLDCINMELNDSTHLSHHIKILILNNVIFKVNHINSLQKLQIVYLINCAHINAPSLTNVISKSMWKISKLVLLGNAISVIKSHTFLGFASLTEIDLSLNPLHTLHTNAFNGLAIKTLNLIGMKLELISDCAFCGMSMLIMLNLSDNNIQRVSCHMFDNILSLTQLDLRKNNINFIEVNSFANSKLKLLFVDNLEYCCFAKSNIACRSTNSSQFITIHGCSNLLSNAFVNYTAWPIISILSIFNLLALVYHLSWYNGKSYFLLIINAVFCEALYSMSLVITLLAHASFGKQYVLQQASWRSGFLCQSSMVLLLTSFIMSKYTSFALTYAKLLLTKYAMEKQPVSRQITRLILLVGWITSLLISLALVLFTAENRFENCYPNNFFPALIPTSATIAYISLLFVTLVVEGQISRSIISFLKMSGKKIKKTKETQWKTLFLRQLVTSSSHMISFLCFIFLVFQHYFPITLKSDSVFLLLVLALNPTLFVNPYIHTVTLILKRK